MSEWEFLKAGALFGYGLTVGACAAFGVGYLLVELIAWLSR